MKDSQRLHIAPFVAYLFLCAVLPLAARAGNWSWRMPTDIYQNLDFEKRAAIDRGRDAFIRAENASNRNLPVPDQIPLYRAAAAEWEKFRVQFELSADVPDAVNAYVLFMSGMSLQGARDRNTAIKKYQELLDFFTDETWLTPAAIYMTGKNRLDNGETSRAKNSFEEIIDNPDMLSHPLASRAFRHLGQYYWEIGKYEQAQELWRRGADPQYREIATDDYNWQRTQLRTALGLSQSWSELEAFIFEGIDPDNTKGQLNALISCEDHFRNGNVRNQWNSWYFDVKCKGDAKKIKEAWAHWNTDFSKWHERHKELFRVENREWDFLLRAIGYRREYSDKEAKKLIPEITELLKSSSPDQMTARARQFAFTLCDFSMHDEARTLIPYVKDPIQQLFFTYDLDARVGKWEACVISLEALIANKEDPAAAEKAKDTLAWVYKDRIQDYEKALKLYREFTPTPARLWSIYECYRRWGKKKEGYATLQEIAFFPDWAARAVYRQAEDYLYDGEKKMAIALYRRLLSQPEWKKTWESSQAHQRLEGMGIATGGAVINTVR